MDLQKQVARHQRRRAHGRRRSFWQSLGLLGAVGWTVVVPALLGLALGSWLDRGAALSFSCRLPGLLGGLCFGCAAAWQRVRQEWLTLQREDSGP